MFTKTILSVLLSLGLIRAAFNPSNVNISLVLQNSTALASTFSSYASHFGKTYTGTEAASRLKIFAKNLALIQTINNDKSTSFNATVNNFTDTNWTTFAQQKLFTNNVTAQFEEFQLQYPQMCNITDGSRAARYSATKSRRLQTTSASASVSTGVVDYTAAVALLTQTVSWKNYAEAVQDEMTCAACYAFAGVGAFETAYTMQYGNYTKLSEQEIIDCSLKNDGCIGGNPYLVLKYIHSTGLSLDTYYPFQNAVEKCTAPIAAAKRIPKQGYYDMLNGNILALLTALENGPVAVIHVASTSLKQYSSGVFDASDCTGTLNHSAVAVGYDLTATVPYILIKNAWGVAWGEAGYYRLAIGALNSSNVGTCLIVSHSLNVAPYFE